MRHKLRGVKWTLTIGVRFVGKVARRSDVSFEAPLLLLMPFATDRPPALLTSQHRTVQSAPPVTKTEDSALKASEWMRPVWPAIVLTQFPEPRSHNLILRSSPALARYLPSVLIDIAVIAP